MKSTIKLLQALSNANGISGFEDEVVDIIKSYETDRFTYEEDSLRNVYMTSKNTKSDSQALTIMLDAHSDEVGFIVQSIKNNGLIKFLPVGGWIANNVAAQKVRIRNSEGEHITGVIASKPPHFMSQAERDKPLSFDNMFIDVGASSRVEVEEIFKIEVGAPVVPDVDFEMVEQNGILIGKAFDNRIGCTSLLETMKRLTHDYEDKNIIGAIASQEEVGTRGAIVTSRKVKPDIAIVFEGTPSDDGFKGDDEAQAVLKKGPQIRHMDRSMITNPRFVKFVRQIAKDNEIPFQDAVRSGGGTNGGSIHLSQAGIPTIVIGVPVRYIHSHYGITADADLESCIEWAVKIIESITKEDVAGF